MMPELSATVTDVFAGVVAARWPGKPPSAIAKIAVAGPQTVTWVGLATDAQADLTVHGGRSKAIHHYPAEHYAMWRADLGDRAVFRPGGFGENLSTLGMTEATVCIGDVFTWGSAVVQVSQGRQPCWKLAAHAEVPEMAYLVQKTLCTGWYYRVLQKGVAGAGDILTLTERPHPEFTVRRVTGARLAPGLAQDEARALAGLAALDDGWRAAFLARAT